MFDIRQHVDFDQTGRALCPSCSADGKTRKKNLSINLDSGAYKCHRGCTPEQIRQVLGTPKPGIIPQALATTTKATTTPQQVRADMRRLVDESKAAMQWLNTRGITLAMITHYQLGVSQCRLGNKRTWGISIPIPNADKTAYWLKKRVAPWDDEVQGHSDYQPWKQFGVPPQVYFTHHPKTAHTTWLCEGEWDSILLGWLVKNDEQTKDAIAVATFTCGAGAIPPTDQLDRLPGDVVTWYDRNDKPLKNGERPGDKGAAKVASTLGKRGKVGAVPMPDGCEVHGWDVSDAIKQGYTVADFLTAAKAATQPTEKPKSSNPLRDRLKWNDDLVAHAPDYTNFLVPDLLTEDELFLLAAGPRTGKSLFAMTLAKAVAEGSEFLGRPCTQGTVIYVKCEDNDTKIKEREAAQGWSAGLPVAWLDTFKLSEVDHLDELAEELDPRLIVLDTLSRIKDSSVNESSAEMSQVLEPLQEMAKRRGCCILLVHHTGKVSVENANQLDVFDTIRGSSAIRAVCRGALVLAAGERDFRLVVENGWGKHDLKVILDANTLTWRLLGHWQPIVNTSQKDAIVNSLQKLGSASVEQLSEDTGIPKKSLYEQLSRLQISEIASEKVIKEGSRRKYIYRLAIFNTIQQLNSVLNSENSDGDSVTGYSQQNIISVEPPVSQSLAATAENGHPIQPQTCGIVACNPDSESVSPIQHPIQHHPSVLNIVSQSIPTGARVEVLTGRFSGKYGKVTDFTDGLYSVLGDGWAITRSYAEDDLWLCEPVEGS